jgi:hypothetical protein
MDQLKVILKHVQKHHFWLLCVGAIVAAMVGWMMARKSLSADYDRKKGNIVAKFDRLNGLMGIENHPNSTWKEKVDELTVAETKTVTSAWQTVYIEQQKLLAWPAELGPDFSQFVSDHPRGEIDGKLRDRYGDRIKKEFPRLLKIVDAASFDADKMIPDKNAPVAEPHEYKVKWDSASQQDIKQSLDFQTRPTSQQVRQTQEDLWVYEAVLNIIKAVNTGKWVAPVKQISAIQIGLPAAGAFKDGMAPGHIERLTSSAPAAGGPAGGAYPAAQVLGATAEGAPKPAADDGRYVDADGNGLNAASLAGQQFKRMPIFLRLTVDERELPKLLAECANSPLGVEVRQLRISPSKAGGSAGGGKSTGTAPAGGGQPLAGLMRSRAGGAPRPASAAPGAAAAGPGSDGPDAYEVPLELLGIMYIYNPPDPNKLGGQATATTAAGE